MKKTIWLTLLTTLATATAITTVYVACGNKDEFSTASKTYPITFPKDHAAHDDFRTEWWYYTGHLKSDNKTFGYELTFFRTALTLGETESSALSSSNKNIYFAHFAITDEQGKKFYFAEKQGRGSFGDAGAAKNYYKTTIGNWSVQDVGRYQLLQAEITTGETPMSLTLILEPSKPTVLHGENGYSRKGEGETNASMYYSYTRMASTGTLSLGEARYRVEGESWNDHEFSTSKLDANVVGWDWFAVQFADSTELMLYALRQIDGSPSLYSSGTFIDKNGKAEHLDAADFKIDVLEKYTSQSTKAVYPSKWNLSVPKLQLEATVTPTVQDQELRTKESARINYWEGSTEIDGMRNGSSVKGKGYTELTGYGEKFSQRL